jgi:hypothetical protein
MATSYINVYMSAIVDEVAVLVKKWQSKTEEFANGKSLYNIHTDIK